MTGNDIWWHAAKDGTRLTQKNRSQHGWPEVGKISLDWNGASGYRDPSF